MWEAEGEEGRQGEQDDSRLEAEDEGGTEPWAFARRRAVVS